MARITVEDCLQNVENRFGLIHLAAKRVRQLRKGAEPLVVCKNKDIVVALREVAAGNVYPIPEDELRALQAAAESELEALPETTEETPPETPAEASLEAPAEASAEAPVDASPEPPPEAPSEPDPDPPEAVKEAAE